MKPAILYAAKSTEDRHGSIPEQLRDAQAFVEREGWTIAAEHADEGFSAFKGNRGPGLARARQEAAELAREAGEAVLVVQHSDRLARGAGDAPGAAEHLAEIMFWARRNRVQLRSVQDDSTFTNPLLAFAMGERNYEDSRRKSEAVKAGMRRRGAERGRLNGGPRPYGYRWERLRDERGSQLVIEPAEAELVRRIFREFIAGTATAEIARRLNREGVRAQRGGEWYQGTVSKVLANPLYVGRVRLNGEEHPGKHEPLIDEATWEAATRRRELLARSRGQGRGRPPKGQHLFTHGHLRCMSCGEPMIPRTNPNRKSAPYEAYYCYGRTRHGTAFCDQQPVPRAAVDTAVFDYFASVGLDVEATRAQLNAAYEHRLAEARALLEQAERSERQKTEALERLERDYEAGELPAAHYLRLSEKWTTEQAAARAEVEQLERRLREVESRQPLEAAEAAVCEQLAQLRATIAGEVTAAHSVEGVRAALLRLFDHFLIGRVRNGAPERGDVAFEHRGEAYVIWPEPRAEALEWLGVNWEPVLKREPLLQAANKEVKGLHT